MGRTRPSAVTNWEVPAQQANPESVAAYVATLSAELAMLSKRHRLNALGYLLDMVRLEAEGRVHGPKGAAGSDQ